MKYLLLVCWDSDIELGPAEDAALQASLEIWVAENDKRGVRLQGHRLKPSGEAKTVRVRRGSLSVTDGPFVETKEEIAGFDILECTSFEEAVEAASRHPVCRYGAVEVREYLEG